MFFQNEFRDKLTGFADYLRYASLIDRGIVLGKGGELITSFRLVGKDTESSSARELEAISNRVNSAVLRLNAGWMIQCNGFRFESSGYAPEGFFPDPVTRLFDEERRRQYHEEGLHFEGQAILTFTYLPPYMLESKAKEFLFEQSEDLSGKNAAIGAQHLAYFKETVRDIVNELRIELTEIEQLLPYKTHNIPTNTTVTVDPQAGFLHWCATGIRQNIIVPKYMAALGLDTIIGSQDFAGGTMPRIGKKFVKTITVESLPEGTHAGILHILNTIPVAYRWSTRFIFEEESIAEKEIEKHRKKWKQQVRGWTDQFLNKQNGSINHDALNMSQDADLAKALLKKGSVAFGYYTSVIVLYHESADILETMADQVCDALRRKHFVVRDEDLNAVEAFLGSLPGHGYENIRRPMIHTYNLADLLPTTASWQGLEENPCPMIREQYPHPDRVTAPPLFYGNSAGQTPFRGSLHVGDVGHALVVGPTGAGKSTKLAFLIAQFFRYPNAKVFAFDKGYSAYVLNQACGGIHYNIMAEGTKVGFCPLAHVDKLTERAWAEGWVETMLVLGKVAVNSSRRREIRKALAAVGRQPRNLRTLHHFVSILQDKEMQRALEYYTTGTGAGGILNATEDTLEASHFTVFEMETLMEMGDTHVVPVLMYLFRCIERQLDGSPVLIVLDEAWLMLNHEFFQEKLRVWLKVLRKANASVVFATQEIADLHNSAIRDTIYSACMTKIFLPNTDADEEVSAAYYKSLGLTPRQIFLLSKATPKRDYYYVSPYGRRMYQLALGPIGLALTAVAGVANTDKANEFKRKYGSNWVHEWLQDRGVDEEMLALFKRYAANQSQYNIDKFAA
ncbi:TraG/VirB4 family ATPase [Trinickia mobilis]|uniref:TraG/VirB4 family ATPase n=1 Tax=Trinickia mobilis TaxID=2816356 RepID=UPI001A8DBAB6|nr:transporter [Trinickia mobilis]